MTQPLTFTTTYVDYIKAWEHVCTNMQWSGDQRDEVPLKLTTFSYFRDYFLNKIITEIGKNKTKNFFPFAWGGSKVHGKTGWGAMAGLAPLDPPLSEVID